MRWFLGWIPLVFLMIANGVLRQSVYGPAMSELRAHQLSTVTAALILLAYLWALFDRLDIEAERDAWSMGALWLALTVAFEFAFGRWVVGHSWARLVQDYNLAQGRVWSLFLVWIVLAPWIVWRARGR